MDYTVSPSSQHTRYRALNLMKPTTELSGRYSCHVVSMANQDAEDQVMVVYAPPRSFDFNYTKMSSEAVNFTCEADGVFPMPKITLLRVDLPEQEPNLVSKVKTVTTAQRGAYYVQVSREVRDWELSEEPTVFECILSIPGTDYENQRKILYFPGDDKQILPKVLLRMSCVVLELSNKRRPDWGANLGEFKIPIIYQKKQKLTKHRLPSKTYCTLPKCDDGTIKWYIRNSTGYINVLSRRRQQVYIRRASGPQQTSPEAIDHSRCKWKLK
ncbi:uncharacterized protein TNCT_732962 [Trichonephila clavata]|nr:uncharacterized protein TNCT_732962 [Trichonephila clavata]